MPKKFANEFARLHDSFIKLQANSIYVLLGQLRKRKIRVFPILQKGEELRLPYSIRKIDSKSDEDDNFQYVIDGEVLVQIMLGEDSEYRFLCRDKNNVLTLYFEHDLDHFPVTFIQQIIRVIELYF